MRNIIILGYIGVIMALSLPILFFGGLVNWQPASGLCAWLALVGDIISFTTGVILFVKGRLLGFFFALAGFLSFVFFILAGKS